MTIGTNNRMDYVGTGAVATYSYNFKVFAASDLRVTVRSPADVETELAYPGDFTVTGAGNAAGGSISLTGGALANGYALTIRRVTTIRQTTDIRNQSAVFNDVLEDALDRLTMIDQQQQDELDRSLKLPETASPTNFDPTMPVPEDNKFLSWELGGDGVMRLINVNIEDVVSIAASENKIVDSFADGVDFTAGTSDTVTLSQLPGAKENILITFDGVVQHHDTFAVADKVVTFTAAIPVGVAAVEAQYTRTLVVGITASENVTWIGSAAGSVQRNVRDRLRDMVFVTDFMSAGQFADLSLATPLVDQSAAIQAAIDSGAKFVYFPYGNYRVDNTITLKDGVTLIGASAGQGSGASIRFSKNDGTHCFASAQNNFLSFVTVENFEIVNTANAAGNVATGDAFNLFGVTNNCAFKNLLIRNFGGDAFNIGQQTLNPADKTAAQNVLFERVFVTSCGGYAFDINGYVNATWLMCDLNSCATGFFRFQDGTTNQTQINLYGCWIEGTQAWTALTVFDMVDTKGQMLNIVGGNITNGRAGTSRIVKSTTSSCRLNVVGLTGFGWTYLHEDTPAGLNVALSAPTNRFQSILTPQITVQGSGPISELYEMVAGTVDQRRFRWQISANKLLLSARTDAGASVRNLISINHNTGALLPEVDNSYSLGAAANRWSTIFGAVLRPGGGTVQWTSGAGTPEGSLVASVGSLYTRTDGGASTTLYVKESGSGNTGWVAK